MQEAYRIGNAQSIGSYQIQSSYFASGCPDGGCAGVLTDGTADHINGRRCAVLAAEAYMRAFASVPREAVFPAFFDAVATRVLRDMREIIYLGKTPHLSVSCQWIRDRELFYYSVGSNHCFLSDGSSYQLLNDAYGRIHFEKGMTAGMISRGVWEALNEKEMLSYLGKREHPYDKAQRMLLGVKEKNKKMAGTAAILLIEGCL